MLIAFLLANRNEICKEGLTFGQPNTVSEIPAQSHESSFNLYSWARIHRTIHGHIVKVFIKILRVMSSNSHENRGQFVMIKHFPVRPGL